MKILLMVLSLTFSFNTFARGGDEVRNGGGLIEQYFTYALKILPNAIDRCLASHACSKNLSQKELLIKIKNSHQEEINAGILKFYSAHPTPDFFMIDGVERLAITGNYVGSPIYYNVKMLYDEDVRIELGHAIQSLIHELGHHHGVVDHNSLELLGSEVRRVVETISMEIPYFVQSKITHFKVKAITVMALGRGLDYDSDAGTLNFLFKNMTLDTNDLFKPLSKKCESLGNTVYNSLQFFNLHWDFKADELTSNYKYLSGNVNLYCMDKNSRILKNVFKFDMKIKVSTDGNYTYESSELVDEPKLIFSERLKIFRARRPVK